MLITTSQFLDKPIRVTRHEGETVSIWLTVGGDFSVALSPAESQQLIAELQRELSRLEAVVRGAAA